MASGDALQQAVDDLKTQWAPSFSSERFRELVILRLRPLSDVQVRRLTDHMLDNCDAGKLRISDVTHAVRYVLDSEPPAPLSFFGGEPTYKCPRCHDLGLQLVLVESRSAFAGELYEYVEPCDGVEGRECSAGLDRRESLLRVSDSGRVRVIDRFAIHDAEGVRCAMEALRRSAVPK